jgi:hypothetical protein
MQKVAGKRKLDSLAGRMSARLIVRFCHDDQQPDPPIVPRFLQVATAYHRALEFADAGLAEPVVHERGYEPVRADFSGAGEMPVHTGSRGGHAEVHPGRW